MYFDWNATLTNGFSRHIFFNIKVQALKFQQRISTRGKPQICLSNVGCAKSWLHRITQLRISIWIFLWERHKVLQLKIWDLELIGTSTETYLYRRRYLAKIISSALSPACQYFICLSVANKTLNEKFYFDLMRPQWTPLVCVSECFDRNVVHTG